MHYVFTGILSNINIIKFILTFQSTSTSKDVKQSGSILKPDKTSLTPTNTSHFKPEELNQSDSHKPQILKPDSLDLDNPKKRRGRPKSVSTVDSDKGTCRT